MNKRKGDESPEPNRSRLIGCEFSAVASFRKKTGLWHFKVKNLEHNHSPTEDPAAHSENRKLGAEVFAQVKQLSGAGLAPKKILPTIIVTNPNTTILATQAKICAARKKANKEYLYGISPIQHLKETLLKSDFISYFRADETGNIGSLFFCHSYSIQLLKHFPSLVFLDCTYKTNKYRIPLLHICGTSCNNKNFSVAFCFLKEETKDYYTWVLANFKRVLRTNQIKTPQVFMTDRDLALMAAVGD
jgi:hypothetical protein